MLARARLASARARWSWTDLLRWTEFDRGGHFAAMEQPDLLIGDLRESFRKFR